MKLTYRNAYTTEFVLKMDNAEPVSSLVTFTNLDIERQDTEAKISDLIDRYAENVVQTFKSELRDQLLDLAPISEEDEQALFENIAGLIRTEWDKATGCYDPN